MRLHIWHLMIAIEEFFCMFVSRQLSVGVGVAPHTLLVAEVGCSLKRTKSLHRGEFDVR